MDRVRIGMKLNRITKKQACVSVLWRLGRVALFARMRGDRCVFGKRCAAGRSASNHSSPLYIRHAMLTLQTARAAALGATLMFDKEIR